MLADYGRKTRTNLGLLASAVTNGGVASATDAGGFRGWQSVATSRSPQLGKHLHFFCFKTTFTLIADIQLRSMSSTGNKVSAA